MPVLLHVRLRRPILHLPTIKSFIQRILVSTGEPCAVVSVELIGDARMRQLNHRYRGRDTTTDVLAFAMRDAPGPFSELLGDVVISIPRAAKQARERGHTVTHELAVLLIHGILHLLGYDHERDEREARRMRRQEQKILRTLLPISPMIEMQSIAKSQQRRSASKKR